MTSRDVMTRLQPLCRADGGAAVGAIVSLRAGGQGVTPALRDELLGKLREGAHVELELDILAYEQAPGKPNRNFVRFRDGSMLAIGRTGKNTPFLRDHEQHEVLARGGTVIDSTPSKLEGDAGYQVHQTLRLTVPWAVEGVLRGTIDRFSISWIPTGDVLCSACDKPVLTKCWHWPGDRLAEGADDDGNRKLVRKRDGEIVVEWIFTAAELVETSAVNVPAVPSAQIEGIRAALSALSGSAPLLPIGDEESQESIRMSKLTLVAALAAALPALGLAATAGEDEALEAVKKLGTERDALAARLEVAEGERKRLAGEVESYRKDEAKKAEDAFVELALREGRIAPVDEKAWRRLFAVDPAQARADMDERPKGTASPVGLERQSQKPEPAASPAIVSASHRRRIAEMGMTEQEYLAALATEGQGRLSPAKEA